MGQVKEFNSTSLFESSFQLLLVTDTLMLIKDIGTDHRSVTNDTERVIKVLTEQSNLTTQKVYYIDSMGRFDELVHSNGKFIRFAACTEHQQTFLHSLVK